MGTRRYILGRRKRTLWKMFLFYLLSIFFALIFLPALLVGNWWKWESLDGGNPSSGIQQELHPTTEEGEQFLKIYHTEQKKVMELPLEEYITGVVAAEMPASFHPEALKAQAVIARTYALAKAGRLGGCTENPGADLCTSGTCCQAWEDMQTIAQKWPGEEASSYREKIVGAVQSTRGMVLMYQGELAQTVYHSTCGGETEKAVDAWREGCDVPYLQNVKCSFCRHSPHYSTELALDPATYAAALRGEADVLPVLGKGNIPLMEVVQRSSSGRNMFLKIGNSGRLYRGEEIRRLLGLSSTFFRWQTKEDRIVFSTRGYGHGVGLCQYGADGMATEGYNFQEILDFYYKGTEVQLLDY
jgi:stage II sporulation protein D